MDSAGKFVSGDMNAGLFITFINIVGGVFIGVLQKDMGWMEAAQTFSLLTIGDGLVSTIPSLITSTSAGIIVSRAAAEARMGEEFIGQMTFCPIKFARSKIWLKNAPRPGNDPSKGHEISEI